MTSLLVALGAVAGLGLANALFLIFYAIPRARAESDETRQAQ